MFVTLAKKSSVPPLPSDAVSAAQLPLPIPVIPDRARVSPFDSTTVPVAPTPVPPLLIVIPLPARSMKFVGVVGELPAFRPVMISLIPAAVLLKTSTPPVVRKLNVFPDPTVPSSFILESEPPSIWKANPVLLPTLLVSSSKPLWASTMPLPDSAPLTVPKPIILPLSAIPPFVASRTACPVPRPIEILPPLATPTLPPPELIRMEPPEDRPRLPPPPMISVPALNAPPVIVSEPPVKLASPIAASCPPDCVNVPPETARDAVDRVPVDWIRNVPFVRVVAPDDVKVPPDRVVSVPPTARVPALNVPPEIVSVRPARVAPLATTTAPPLRLNDDPEPVNENAEPAPVTLSRPALSLKVPL